MKKKWKCKSMFMWMRGTQELVCFRDGGWFYNRPDKLEGPFITKEEAMKEGEVKNEIADYVV